MRERPASGLMDARSARERDDGTAASLPPNRHARFFIWPLRIEATQPPSREEYIGGDDWHRLCGSELLIYSHCWIGLMPLNRRQQTAADRSERKRRIGFTSPYAHQ